MSLFLLKATHAPVKKYYEALAQFHKHGHTTEGNTRSAFADLLKRCCTPYGWHLVEEYPFKGTAKQSLRADGAIFDNDLPILQGLWEAKDTNDDLDREIKSKVAKGYRRLHALLSRRGYEVNVKRIYRLYVEERLMVRRKRRKRLVREQAAEPRLTGPNQEWAMDFIVDGLATGRMIRILSVVDAYTRECLALEADTSLGSGRVTRVLERVIAERGRPDNVRSDNGPEFTSRRMIGWAEDWKVGLVHIQPGRPMQNGHVESFHGRLRDECLNATWFRTLNDVRCTLAAWREEYNCERPHSSLDYRTPHEFRKILEGRGAMAPLPSPTPTINQQRLQL